MEQSAESIEKKAKPPGRFATFLAGWFLIFTWAGFLGPFLRYQFWQSDTFWLVETGRLILQTQTLPAHDTYSFASSAPHWIQYQWLTEVIFAVANLFGGLKGVAVFGAILMASLFCVMILRKMLKQNINAMVSVFVIGMTAYSFFPDLSSLRPQLFSFLFFWLILAVCMDCKEKMERWKAACIVFLVAAVWANCHISFLAGLLILVANSFGLWIASIRKPEKRELAKTFSILSLAFFIATFFTPYKAELWGYITSVHNLYYTQEVRPLEWDKLPHLVSLTVMALLSQIYLRKKRDLGDLLALLALLWVGSGCGRLIVYFCIFSCPLIGEAASTLLAPILKLKPLQFINDAMTAAAKSSKYVVAVNILAALIVLGQPLMYRHNIPVKVTAEYLATHQLKGNLFCDAHMGSYIMYTFHGSLPVFMDTRMDLYDAAFVQRFADALLEGKGWQELFAQYKIANALVRNDTGLKKELDKRPDWKQVYTDPDFSLYVHDSTP